MHSPGSAQARTEKQKYRAAAGYKPYKESNDMQNDTFPAGESPRVLVIDGQGRLLIEAWDERSFAVEPADMAGAARLEDGTLVVRAARGSVSVRVPAATAIAVENHQGDLRIEAIDGTVRLRDIDGSVFVGGASALVIE